jgi:hypothetical protein
MPRALPIQKRNPHAVHIGRLGGKKGGAARALALSPEKRKAIAQLAAMARWGISKSNPQTATVFLRAKRKILEDQVALLETRLQKVCAEIATLDDLERRLNRPAAAATPEIKEP